MLAEGLAGYMLHDEEVVGCVRALTAVVDLDEMGMIVSA